MILKIVSICFSSVRSLPEYIGFLQRDPGQINSVDDCDDDDDRNTNNSSDTEDTFNNCTHLSSQRNELFLKIKDVDLDSSTEASNRSKDLKQPGYDFINLRIRYDKNVNRSFHCLDEDCSEWINLKGKDNEHPLQEQESFVNDFLAFGKIKLKETISQVYFSSFSAHHPSEINKIPWRHLNKEWWRLHTFSKYPRNAHFSSILLARQGFVYIGNGEPDDDSIICVFCMSAVKNLDHNMNIEDLHHNLNPNCPVVRRKKCGNTLIKDYDAKLIPGIFHQLYHLQSKDNLPSDNTDNQHSYEDQVDTMEVDAPGPPPISDNLSQDNAEIQVPTEPSTNRITSHHSHYQATDNNAPFEYVTNRAQSMSLSATATAAFDEHDGNQIAGLDAESVGVDGIDGKTKPDGSAGPTATPSSGVSSSSNRYECDGPSVHSHNSDPTLTPVAAIASGGVTKPDSSAGPSARSSSGRSSSSSRYECDTPSIPDLSTVPRSQNASDSSSSSRPQESQIAQPVPTPSNNSPALTDAHVSTDSAPQSSTGTSYEKLGIITARPKRHEYAVEVTRLNSFEGWPLDHHIKPEDLAKAGYFYTGYSDCARCFYCGGGLRNWEIGDDVWVEHARWFPSCAYMRQCVGQPFIDVVQDLNKEKELIPYEDVIKEMRDRGLENSIPRDIKNRSLDLERDAAVKTVTDLGYRKGDVIKAAEIVKEKGLSLDAGAVYEELLIRDIPKVSQPVKSDNDSQNISKKGTDKRNRETIESIKSENSQLRQQSQCKICMDKEVAVVFLPCGHLISCNDCSFALKLCPVCRDSIKGVVRASLA